MGTPGYPRNIVLDGGPHPTEKKGRRFGATFAKLLWPLVLFHSVSGKRGKVYQCIQFYNFGKQRPILSKVYTNNVTFNGKQVIKFQ